jgi:hypothetical protein
MAENIKRKSPDNPLMRDEPEERDGKYIKPTALAKVEEATFNAKPPAEGFSPVVRRILNPDRHVKNKAVVIGTSGQIRERSMPTSEGPKRVVTHIAKGIDPKILKADRRAALRLTQGRWTGYGDPKAGEKT